MGGSLLSGGDGRSAVSLGPQREGTTAVSDGVAMVKMLLDLPGMNVLKVTEADGEPVIESRRP